MVENRLNLRPRKCLGYLTPHEVFQTPPLTEPLRFAVESKTGLTGFFRINKIKIKKLYALIL